MIIYLKYLNHVLKTHITHLHLSVLHFVLNDCKKLGCLTCTTMKEDHNMPGFWAHIRAFFSVVTY